MKIKSATESSNNNDLTEGVIWKKLLLYFLPIAAGTLFQQLYNAVDAVIVSRFVGTEALAAVGGSPATITQLVIGFFVALSSGAGVVIAQYFGSKEKMKITLAVRTSMLLCAAIGAVLTVAMFFGAEPILNLLRTPAETVADATVYMRIFFAGSIFMLVFNMGSGILRGVGDSRTPFIYLVVSCVCNIVLDLLFVVVFHMEVAGVAWATTIAQFVSCVLVTVRLMRTKEYYRLDLSSWKINPIILKRMLAIGVPSGVQSAMYGVSNIILQIGVNSLGTVVVASWSMSGKIDGVYWALSNALGTAVMNFVAQNYGAEKMDRIRQCTKTGYLMSFCGTVVISGILLLVARPLLHIFTKDPAVVETTWTIILFFAPSYMLWTVIEIFSAILRGIGDAVKPTVITALGVCVFRIIWILTAFQWMPTLEIMCIGYPASWLVTDIPMVLYYRKRSKAGFGLRETILEEPEL